jgi:hypothetical protein
MVMVVHQCHLINYNYNVYENFTYIYKYELLNLDSPKGLDPLTRSQEFFTGEQIGSMCEGFSYGTH